MKLAGLSLRDVAATVARDRLIHALEDDA